LMFKFVLKNKWRPNFYLNITGDRRTEKKTKN
jgi:hypothetical protein